MKKQLLFILMLAFLSLSINAQVLFQTVIIPGSSNDYGNAIKQTLDSNYIVCGSTSSIGAGLSDGYIAKLNKYGSLVWTKTIGGTDIDEFRDIIQNSDGDYIAVGQTSSFGTGGGASSVYIVKLNPTGSVLWAKAIGASTKSYVGYSIVQSADGGYIIAGEEGISQYFFILKVDNNGAYEWCETLGYGVAYSIILTNDGGFITAGQGGSGSDDMLLAKFNSLGTLLWTKTIAGTNTEGAYEIIQTSDQGYAVSGYTNSYGTTGPNVYVAKLDSTGLVQWTRTIGTDAFGYSLIQINGGLVIVGQYSSSLYCAKLDINGNLLWTKIFTDITGRANSVVKTNDGGFVLTGQVNSTNMNIYVAKLDGSGHVCDSTNISTGGTLNSGGTYGTYGTVTTGTGTNYVGGLTGTGGTVQNICFYNPTVGINEIPDDFTFALYPNPSNGIFKFQSKTEISKIAIMNMLGEIVYSSQANSEIVNIDLSKQAKGIYFYQINSDKGILKTGKVILE